MNRGGRHQQHVTLMLQDRQGRAWPLRMSAGCEIFVGRYRRLPEFGVGQGLLVYS